MMRDNINEEKVRSLLYFGLQEGECAKQSRWDKVPAPVFRVARKGKMQEGRLQYFYVPIPEYYIGQKNQQTIGFRLIKRNRKEWPVEKLYDYLREAMAWVKPDDYYVHPAIRLRLGGEADGDLPPLSLMEVMMSEAKKSKNVAIRLPDERQYGVAELLIHLLKPYLPRINTIAIMGETSLYEELEEYFYEEYGIMVNRIKRPQKDALLIDFWSGEQETVNFLDTMVKNGYNTKVN
ncbi:MAG: hypothetical protein LBV33_01845 [Lachnospiraceae bacterium]|jgi:hypothetical protein|nr:hypothetical protein [Lachnospiraceae bacterium]